MAQLPPSAVFGAVHPTEAIHVLFLIENSLRMVEHSYALQRQILPSVLGAIRLANPGIDVQIFWETTGKTQDQSSSQKSQRHFNDFPRIDIVGLPRNRISPLFVRRSIELFRSSDGTTGNITRHVVVVAMSDPVDDTIVSPDMPYSRTSEDAKWDAILARLQEDDIVLHLIANPSAALGKLFNLYRRTMQAQFRHEVVPWNLTDSGQCKCHLSGRMQQDDSASLMTVSLHEWPEIISESFEPLHALQRPRHAAQRGLSFPPTSQRSLPTDDGLVIDDNPLPLGEGASLVSRMQAIHGLAKKRPDRNRPGHISFFREESPKRERGPSHNRERLRHAAIHPIVTQAPGVGVSGASRSSLSPTSNRPESHAMLRIPLDATSHTMYRLPSPTSDTSSTSSPSPLWPPNGSPSYDGEEVPRSQGFTTRMSPVLPQQRQAQGFQSSDDPYTDMDNRIAGVQSQRPVRSTYQGLGWFGTPMGNPINNSYSFNAGLTSSDALQRPRSQAPLPAEASHTTPATPLSNSAANAIRPSVTISAPGTIIHGDTPFLFDAEYEARSAMRLQQAIRTLDSQPSAMGTCSRESLSPPGSANSSSSLPPQSPFVTEQYEYEYPNNAYSDSVVPRNQSEVSLRNAFYP